MMSQNLMVSCVVCGVLAAPTLQNEKNFSAYTFHQYVKDFSKNYYRARAKLAQDPYEQRQMQDIWKHREMVFYENLAMINAHNRDEGKSWHAGVNEMTDLKNEEFRLLYTSKIPRGLRGAVEEPEAGRELSGLPSRVDWREKNVVTPAKNQGQCGSCWAFSATETLESHYAIASNVKPAPILAPQQIVSCAPNPLHCGGGGGCSGSTQPIAFNYTSTIGLTTEASYPYEGVTGTCDPSKIEPVVINSGSFSLPENDYTALVKTVATKGPVAISVAASSMGWQFYYGGIFEGGLFGCGFEMDHAVQLVGYGEESGTMYWLVRNSWGDWGERGYIRMKRFGEGKEPCGVDNDPDACKGNTTKPTYCGLCGILSSSSYPTNVRRAAA